MSEEMSTACTTYAQWLDDSTQVSAKDLVIYTFSALLSLCLCLPLRSWTVIITYPEQA